MLLSLGVAVAQTILQGTVRDDKEALAGATVKAMQGGEVIRGAITDLDGNYRITLDPGSYDLEVSYTGYAVQRTEGVQVLSNKLNSLDFTLASGLALNEVEIKAFKVPLINKDGTESGGSLTSTQIKQIATRNVQQIVATTAGVTSSENGDVNIKGGRASSTNYYIDGVRVSGGAGGTPPVQDIEQLQVITGGLGAEYGDVTGGVISIITKGPASEYHGGIEVENSHGLDPFGYLLATGNLSGPILRKKLENGGSRTLVGFRLSGQVLDQKDGDPPALPVYHAKESVLARLNAHPLVANGGSGTNAAEFLTRDSVDAFKYNPNNKQRDINLTGKLDFRLTEAIDVSVTGTFQDGQDQFSPTDDQVGESTWELLNSQNNPTNYTRRYRGLARFRHRLGNADPDKNASSKSVSISNASYQIQFGFERGLEHRYDKRHKNNYFDYGYIGNFDFSYDPMADEASDGTISHTGYTENFDSDTYAPGTQNPGLAAYNEFSAGETYSPYVAKNGLFSTQYDNIWSDLHVNINQVYDRNSKSQKDLITLMASSSFDLKLGKTGVHNIQFGLINEQRTERSWVLTPFDLWNLMNQSANIQFNGLDTTRIIGRFWDPELSPRLGDSIDQYAISVSSGSADSKFFREARKIQGLALDQYLNVNALRPDQFRLDMFSARELIEQNLVGYYGYDYLGNKVADGTQFNDFFSKRDAEGIRTFPVAPLQPLYQAAYIKDKFQFNKMIFSLGLRVERFDLNTQVMKDPYSLYPIINAKDFFATHQGTRPNTVGDDFKVYVQDAQDPTPFAFRDGDVWYDANGIQANDGNQLYGQKIVFPFLLDTIAGDDIFDTRFNPDLAFEDYTPQINWLPRLAFSFPISDDANFFAHYDVLVQRPPDNWQVTALNYAYFETPSRTPTNNANLKPERVVDYEVGFQQKLNQNSALKFSAYYREMRDMIQRRTYNQVYHLTTYDTYGNIDFGTVKGFTVQYDLRRIQNAEFRLAYTLQFADGTGSDANSQRGLTRQGNIRNLFPLNFDERHNISAILDYRFDEGKRYNGPRLGGKDILANFGINLQLSAASGRPYTSKFLPTRFNGNGTVGAINGNRLPWRFNVDTRVDKSFNLAAAGKKPLNINVYLRVSNLLNRKNVIKVYPVTGSPTDDGFLASGDGQSVLAGYINEGRDVQGYLDSYSYGLLDPNNYSQPRRIFVGAVFEF
ncbi:MAG: TonB-dependent receptor [Saprospiraceae bacterium]